MRRLSIDSGIRCALLNDGCDHGRVGFGANSFVDYLSHLTRKRQLGTGVFGTKIGCLPLAYITKKYDINSIFPNEKFIFVTRQDVVLQAVSWCVAVKTASWASFDKARNNVDYDRDEIIGL